jgi:integrase
MPKISKRLIDTLKPKDAGDLFVWDADLKGFGVRMKPSGSAAYLVQYRTPQGATRRLAFAKIGTITPDEARVRARRLISRAQDGEDPSTERHEARKALTVAELCDEYLKEARVGRVSTRKKTPKRASTVAIDEGRIARHIKPLIGSKVANALAGRDDLIQKLYDDIAAGKTAGTFKTKARGVAKVTGGDGTAGRVVELLGGIWTWGLKRRLVSGESPVRGIEKIKGKSPERILTREELARLGTVLRDHEATRPLAVSALRLIALTGMRREEACALRWKEIDAEGSCIRLESTKTGYSTRPIGSPVLALLKGLARKGEYVFPNKDGTGSADLKRPLAALYNAAGLTDVRSQALRRTFASVGDELGYTEATTGQIIGHAARSVTARHYIRRPDAALAAAADHISKAIAAGLDGKSGAQIVPLQTSATHKKSF